jgi:glycosyltransferase involved in cell wall biosynthesis
MLFQSPHTALYAAFDIFPSHKGAATHIAHFSEALFEFAQNGWLHTLGDGEMPVYQAEENNIELTRFQVPIQNFLERAGKYGQDFYENLNYQTQSLQICHFRDIWSALPILAHKEATQATYHTVFEVNSLPSVELPYRYRLTKTTIEKIQALEKYCLAAAQTLVVPSQVIAQFLENQGVSKSKISVIRNGAILPEQIQNAAPNFGTIAISPETVITSPYIIYFGTLQSWQGVETLLRAFALLPDLDLKLLLCISLKEKFSRPFQKLAEKLGITHKLIWKHKVDRIVLQTLIGNALLSVAPLTACSRNLQQGCCPLKILESMACGVPVIASDLPVTQELIQNQQNGSLVRADRPSELARAIRILVEEQEIRLRLGENAKKMIVENFTWQQKKEELKALYQKIV